MSVLVGSAAPVTSPPPFDLRRDGAALAAAVAISVGLQLAVYDRWLSMIDEGAIAQIADQINHGKLPYRDAVHVALPGIFYVTAALFRVFGPSFLVGRALMVAVFALFVALTYGLTRTVAGRPAALGVALLAVGYRIAAFPHWHMLSYTPVAIVCLMTAVAILAWDAYRPHWTKPPLAGLAVGLGIVFKQDCTTVTLGALALFVLMTARWRGEGWWPAVRRATGFGVAGLVPFVAVVLAFVPAGVALEMLRQTIWFPLVAQPVWGTSLEGAPHPYIGFPPLWPPWGQHDAIRRYGFFSYLPGVPLDLYWKRILVHPLFRDTALPELLVRAVYCLPYAVLGLLGVRELRRGLQRGAPDPQTTALRLLLVFGAALLASFNRPRDWIHLMILYPPTLILLAPVVEMLAGPRPGTRRRVVHGAAAAVVVLSLVTTAAATVAERRFHSVPLSSPRAGISVSPSVAASLEPLLRALAPPDDGGDPAPLAALPYQPTLNFLTGRPLATRFLTVLPLSEFPDRQEQILADLARDPRTEIVYSLQHVAFIPRPQRSVPQVFDALVERYRLGTGPGELFGDPVADAPHLFARLIPRAQVEEQVAYDFAAHLDDAVVREVGGGGEDGRPMNAAADGRVTLQAWPFERPVISVTPASAPQRMQLRYASVDVPPDARLRFGVAVNPDEWTYFLPVRTNFTVRVDGAVVFERRIDPRDRLEDRRWVWDDVPVAAGRRTITFEVMTHDDYNAIGNLVGWARPRLVADSGNDEERR